MPFTKTNQNHPKSLVSRNNSNFNLAIFLGYRWIITKIVSQVKVPKLHHKAICRQGYSRKKWHSLSLKSRPGKSSKTYFEFFFILKIINMYSKEEKLKYGEILRQQVPKDPFRFDKNSNASVTREWQN